MPIPKPRDDEQEDDFISRCMGNDTMVDEYPDNDQRLAICFETWRNRNKGDEMERKSVIVQLKDEKEGSFTARIATLNVVDKDGDRTLPGAFPTGRTVLVSAYQHGSWGGSLPVGKATIREDGEEVLADGEFNLSTQSGREHYEAVKFSGNLQEWSYGYRVDDSSEITEDGQTIRELRKVDPIEISPVLLGAGVGTATLAIKKQGSTYAEHADTVLAAVNAFAARTESLADLRRKDGRDLSNINMERVIKLVDTLKGIAASLEEIIAAPEPDREKARKIVLSFLKLQNQLSGVTK